MGRIKSILITNSFNLKEPKASLLGRFGGAVLC